MDTSAMVMVTDENYTEVVEKSTKPVLFVIGAMWCPDCQRIAPLMMSLAQQYGEKILFARADFDSAEGLKKKFNVRSIPTLAIIKGGKLVETLVEPKSIAPVKAFVEKALTA